MAITPRWENLGWFTTCGSHVFTVQSEKIDSAGRAKKLK